MSYGIIWRSPNLKWGRLVEVIGLGRRVVWNFLYMGYNGVHSVFKPISIEERISELWITYERIEAIWNCRWVLGNWCLTLGNVAEQELPNLLGVFSWETWHSEAASLLETWQSMVVSVLEENSAWKAGAEWTMSWSWVDSPPWEVAIEASEEAVARPSMITHILILPKIIMPN